MPHEPGRQRRGDRGARRAQHGGLRLRSEGPTSSGSPTTSATGCPRTCRIDELNHVTKTGQRLRLPVLPLGRHGRPASSAGARTASRLRQARAADRPARRPLGMRFYTGKMFPAKYQNAIFIARHGPWNRTQKYAADVIVAWPDGKGGIAKIGAVPDRPGREQRVPRPPGRRAGDEGRLAARLRRPQRRDLPHQLQAASELAAARASALLAAGRGGLWSAYRACPGAAQALDARALCALRGLPRRGRPSARQPLHARRWPASPPSTPSRSCSCSARAGATTRP